MSTRHAGTESDYSKPLRSLFLLAVVLFGCAGVNAGTWDDLTRNVTKSVSDAASQGVDAVTKGVTSTINGSASQTPDQAPVTPQSTHSAPPAGGLRLNAPGSIDCLKVQPAPDDKAMLTNTCPSEILVLISPSLTAQSCLQFKVSPDKASRVAYGSNGVVRAVCHNKATSGAIHCKCGP